MKKNKYKLYSHKIFLKIVSLGLQRKGRKLPETYLKKTQIMLYNQRHWYCDICDQTIRNKSKRRHLQRQTHDAFSSCIRLKHTIKQPNVFDTDESFNDYITSQKNMNHFLLKVILH